MFIFHHTPADNHDPTKDCPWPGTLNPMLATPLAAVLPSWEASTGGGEHPRMLVKVCGMRNAENIRAVEAAGADWMGFIFCETSPRHVVDRPAYLPEHCVRVGVFVDAAIDTIAAKQAAFGLSVIQLHGQEPPGYCTALRAALPEGMTLMKMLPIRTAGDLGQTDAYEDVVDMFLLEPKAKADGMEHYGGSGRQFDWQLVEHYTSCHPFLLSGGIRPEDASELVRLNHPRLLGYDLNSRFEIAPALKDATKIRTFIQTIRPEQ